MAEKSPELSMEQREKISREEFFKAEYGGIRGSPEDLQEKILTRWYQNTVIPQGTPLFKAVSQLIVRQSLEDWFNTPRKQEFLQNLIEEFKLEDTDAVILRNAIDIKQNNASSALLNNWKTDMLREEGSSAVEMNRRLYLTVAGREAVSSPSSRAYLSCPLDGMGVSSSL